MHCSQNRVQIYTIVFILPNKTQLFFTLALALALALCFFNQANANANANANAKVHHNLVLEYIGTSIPQKSLSRYLKYPVQAIMAALSVVYEKGGMNTFQR